MCHNCRVETRVSRNSARYKSTKPLPPLGFRRWRHIAPVLKEFAHPHAFLASGIDFVDNFSRPRERNEPFTTLLCSRRVCNAAYGSAGGRTATSSEFAVGAHLPLRQQSAAAESVPPPQSSRTV